MLAPTRPFLTRVKANGLESALQHRVFVYGTLLRGERNHGYLKCARFLGSWRTAARFSLWSLGSYPVACADGTMQLYGEVYRVDERCLSLLDQLEEVPEYYQRASIKTPWGPTWIYLQPGPPSGSRLLPAGNWRRRGGSDIRRLGFEAVSLTQVSSCPEQY